jgi:hypothetical protein
MEILSHLDLSPDMEKTVTASIKEVGTAHEAFIRRMHRARNETVMLLSRPEPVDKKRFGSLNDEIVQLMIQNNHIMREHLLDIRDRLGDENGARFFSEMLKRAQKRDMMEP